MKLILSPVANSSMLPDFEYKVQLAGEGAFIDSRAQINQSRNGKVVLDKCKNFDVRSVDYSLRANEQMQSDLVCQTQDRH